MPGRYSALAQHLVYCPWFWWAIWAGFNRYWGLDHLCAGLYRPFPGQRRAHFWSRPVPGKCLGENDQRATPLTYVSTGQVELLPNLLYSILSTVKVQEVLMNSLSRTAIRSAAWVAAGMIIIVVFHIGGSIAHVVGQFSPLTGAFIGGSLTLFSAAIPMSKREGTEPWNGLERF